MTSENGWIEVKCPFCEGTGRHPEKDWWMHPKSFRDVVCETCKGNRILLARPVEFKKMDVPSIKKEGVL